MNHPARPTTVQRLQEFSVPLLAGVAAALLVANFDYPLYHRLVHAPLHEMGSLLSAHPTASVAHQHTDGWRQLFTLHFLINDVFMVFFFGIAAKEITEACLPGGALNPVRKALNPLMGTLGGVLGPATIYVLLNRLIGQPEWQNGWGIPTATDIALAWLVARFVFGKGHPAVSFLLLLAVADDGIGLGIIAIAYPDPAHPTLWLNALWIVPGMLLAYSLRRMGVRQWVAYVALAGGLCWWGLYSAHLHPALALVFVVPFLPGPKRDLGLYEDDETPNVEHSPLEQFEHHLKMVVDFGLFFFAFANAGVPFAGMSQLTWIVLTSLIMGKTLGIFTFSFAAECLGFPLPEGMTRRHLAVAGSIAGMGLTVALFVCGQAFSNDAIQGAAKMGALFSIAAPLLAVALDRAIAAAPALAQDWAWRSGRLGRVTEQED
jgi:NhaA family Na+:H+ antiporter